MAENERRRSERIQDKIRANVIIEGSNYECEVHNYSDTGAYLKFKDDFPPVLRLNIIGQPAKIKVPDSDKGKIPEQGKCIRLVNQDGEEFLAVHFPAYVDYLEQIND